MNRLAGYFIKAGVVYALAGFTLGTVMGARGDFTFTSVHSHLNLLGWVTMAVYAAYYQLVPAASAMRSARAHFWLANAGLLVLTASVAMLASGFEKAAPGAALGSILTLASMALFTSIVFRSA